MGGAVGPLRRFGAPGAQGGEAIRPGHERRAGVRRSPHRLEPLARVRLRTGRDLEVVDVSDTGLLADGRARLLPGTHLDVHVVSATGRQLVRCRVVRSHVSRIEADGVSYRSGLAFHEPVDTQPAGYPVPTAVRGEPTGLGTSYPEAATEPAA